MADPRADGFFAGAERWRDELAALRAILRDSPLTETFKWRSPCYTYRDGNVAAIWGLRECCALAFFKGALLPDARGLLVAPGEHSRSMRRLPFTSVAEIAARRGIVGEYVRDAIAVQAAGLKVAAGGDVPVLPRELRDRLEDDPAFRAAFEALTPGRQRGYVLHVSRARQAATRLSRIETCRPRILRGKGLHDR